MYCQIANTRLIDFQRSGVDRSGDEVKARPSTIACRRAQASTLHTNGMNVYVVQAGGGQHEEDEAAQPLEC